MSLKEIISEKGFCFFNSVKFATGIHGIWDILDSARYSLNGEDIAYKYAISAAILLPLTLMNHQVSIYLLQKEK